MATPVTVSEARPPRFLPEMAAPTFDCARAAFACRTETTVVALAALTMLATLAVSPMPFMAAYEAVYPVLIEPSALIVGVSEIL